MSDLDTLLAGIETPRGAMFAADQTTHDAMPYDPKDRLMKDLHTISKPGDVTLREVEALRAMLHERMEAFARKSKRSSAPASDTQPTSQPPQTG